MSIYVRRDVIAGEYFQLTLIDFEVQTKTLKLYYIYTVVILRTEVGRT